MSDSETPRLAAGEMELLSVLWRTGPVTISEAHRAYDQPIGYTTMQTRLNRLVKKGLLRRDDGRPSRYHAVARPEDVGRADLDLLVQHVSDGRVAPLVAHLVRDRKISREEFEELRALLADAEKTLNKTPKPRRGGKR